MTAPNMKEIVAALEQEHDRRKNQQHGHDTSLSCSDHVMMIKNGIEIEQMQ